MDIVEVEEEARVRRAHQDLKDLMPDLDAANSNYESVLARGNPETVLVSYVDEHWPDLIVTGTHGHTGVKDTDREALAKFLALTWVQD